MTETLNHPSVSDVWAMQDYPNARDAELQALLNLAPLFPGCSVVDIQAAGGYLSDGIYNELHGNVELICIEPEKALNQRLNPNYRVVEDKVEKWSSIESGTVDIVVGLAGLHHSQDQQSTVDEAFRVLKAGGFFAICDVIDDSPVANWLNDYVDKYSVNGHQGDFLSVGEIRSLMKTSGFNNLRESIESVPWMLPDTEHVALFFKGLFGLKPSVEEVQTAIRQYFNLLEGENFTKVPWQLIYALGQKN